MESPESGNGAGNCSVGSIVWVRRRNGSWWPGKILGPDELSASHVMSPRSGTPVKLLGRKDASVDWYNLEKSKRVKAFRCGEFDDCIERAEATQGMPPKKREKYARREDAILHALELEKQMIDNRSEEVVYSSECKGCKSPLLVEKELLMASECLEVRSGGLLLPRSEDASKGLSLPNEDMSKDKDVCLQEVKEEIQFHVADNDSLATRRMRGLLEFGLQSAPSDPKNFLLDPSNGSPKNIHENGSCSNHDGGLSSDGVVNDYCENSSDKRKRSQEGPGEDFMAKRHDRHHSCNQVLEKSARFPTSPSQPDNSGNSIFKSEEEQPWMAHPAKRSRYTYLTSEGNADLINTKAIPTMTVGAPAKSEEGNFMQASGAYEDNTIESTEDTETDSSETDSLDSDSDDMASLSEGAASIELQPKYPGKSRYHQGYGSLSSEELEDTSFADEECHPLANDAASTGVGVSRWQLKGKRNNRSLLNRPTYQTGKKFRSLFAGYGPKNPDGMNARRGMKWDHGDWRDQTASRGYWDDSVEYFDPLIVRHQHHEGNIMLIDVDLKVQSSYQRVHVPMISLTSKIDGRAMVGHPVQVEVLEDGSTDSLLVGSGEWCHETLEHDTTLPPMWRTARRTANFRVPRPDFSSTCDERAKLQPVDGRKGAAGLSNSGIATERINHLSDRKPSRKPVKKLSLSFNQKTRTLSSIASQQRQSSYPKSSGNNCQVEGLIKPESLPTAVACIPVKLVFSRLQEELIGRHP